MITFLLQVSFCWLVFYVIYYLGLKKLTFFELNRYYLLFSLVFGLIIPILAPYIVIAKPDVLVYQSVSIDQLVISSLPLEVKKSIDYEYLIQIGLNVIYWLGVILVLSKLIVGFYKIYALYGGSDKEVVGDFKILKTNKPHLPFSFFNMVFLSKKIPMSDDFEQVIKHEIAHISQGHTYDVILIEVLKVFFWFNPMLGLYKKQMQQNHEYIADQYVTSGSYDPEYTELLLSKTTTALELALTNKFFNSQIFKRIEMMKTERSKKVKSIRYGLILPLLLVLGLIFAANEIKDVYIDINPSVVSSDTIPTPPPPPPNAPPPPPPPPMELFNVVEQMPRYAGCEEINGSETEKELCAKDKLLKYISDNVKYPAAARVKGQEGQAVVQFVVTKEGKIADLNLLRDPGEGLGEEAMRVINSMNDGPAWTAGKQRGQTVNVLYTMPVKFKLTDDGVAEQINQEGNAIRFGSPPPPPPTFTSKGTRVAVEGYSVVPPPPPPPPSPRVRDELFKVVEEMPRFPGCESIEGTITEKEACAREKLLQYIYGNVKYPEMARIAQAEGQVVIQFVINKTGKIEDLKLLRDPGAGMGDESVKVLEMMNQETTWIAGRQRGKAVDVLYTLPIKFKFQDYGAKDSPTPSLFVVDGKALGVYSSFKEANIDIARVKDVKNLSKLEGKKKYGKKGANGVYLIAYKKADNDTKPTKLEGKPFEDEGVVYFVNGKLLPNKDISKLDPNDIKSITVVKSKKLLKSSYNITDPIVKGVVDIKTKSGDGGNLKDNPIIPIVVKGYQLKEEVKEPPSQPVNAISGKTYPNPTNGTVRIAAEGFQDGKVKMSVIDQTGKVLQTTDVDVQNNAINESIDMSKFANGAYFVTLQQGKEVKSFKVINDNK